VATTDWCIHAVEALGVLWEGAGVGVAIGTFGRESAGARIELSHVRVAGSGSRLRRGLEGRGLQRRVMTVLERAQEAGGATAAVGLRWASGQIGAPWEDFGVEELVMGVGRLDGKDVSSRSGRMLVVEMNGGKDEKERREARAAMLGAIMGVLLGRCRLGFVPGPVDASRRVTPSEQVILEQLVLGRSVREIAEGLDRSPHTVHDHVKSLHRKLRARSRGELIARALGHIGGEDVGPAQQNGAATPAPAYAAGA
jgi:DNA-binding CsgD family transcriptional regulator